MTSPFCGAFRRFEGFQKIRPRALKASPGVRPRLQNMFYPHKDMRNENFSPNFREKIPKRNFKVPVVNLGEAFIVRRRDEALNAGGSF